MQNTKFCTSTTTSLCKRKRVPVALNPLFRNASCKLTDQFYIAITTCNIIVVFSKIVYISTDVLRAKLKEMVVHCVQLNLVHEGVSLE